MHMSCLNKNLRLFYFILFFGEGGVGGVNHLLLKALQEQNEMRGYFGDGD